MYGPFLPIFETSYEHLINICWHSIDHHLLNLISIEVFESPLVDLEAFTQIGDVSLHPTDVDAVILGPSRLFR